MLTLPISPLTKILWKRRRVSKFLAQRDSLHIWQMLHYCYCQHSQNIILGFWDVSQFCDKLRMSVRRVTLLLYLSCLRLALNLLM